MHAASLPGGLSEVMRKYPVASVQTHSAPDLVQRISAAYAQGESSAAAVPVFRREAPQAELFEARLEDAFDDAMKKLGAGPAFCLINPPRGGLSPDARRLLARALPFQGILYLSCDPPALARDLKALAPHWVPEWFQPIDLFPRTSHVECLALLRSSSLSPSHSPVPQAGG
ncbi:MAG: hypothetical protein EBY83_07065 [Verrucomicrobia bacterium]|nr:hypothetical protein [Verrucomicrobiota bacterium]